MGLVGDGMVFEIKKYVEDGVEYLPDIWNTPLWELLKPTQDPCMRQVAGLYAAIVDRENYFQNDFTYPAQSTEDYSLYCGVVRGFLLAMEAYERKEDGKIIIRTRGDERVLLIVDLIKKPDICFGSAKCNKYTVNKRKSGGLGWFMRLGNFLMG